jgi:hypothetical protein
MASAPLPARRLLAGTCAFGSAHDSADPGQNQTHDQLAAVKPIFYSWSGLEEDKLLILFA